MKKIRSDDDHTKALEELDRLLDLDPKANTPEGKRFVELAKFIEDYEKEKYPFSEDRDGEEGCMCEENDPFCVHCWGH